MAQSFSIVYLIDSDLGIDGTFWLLSCLTLIYFLFTLVIMKETKGKTVGELQELYWPKSRKQARNVQRMHDIVLNRLKLVELAGVKANLKLEKTINIKVAPCEII